MLQSSLGCADEVRRQSALDRGEGDERGGVCEVVQSLQLDAGRVLARLMMMGQIEHRETSRTYRELLVIFAIESIRRHSRLCPDHVGVRGTLLLVHPCAERVGGCGERETVVELLAEGSARIERHQKRREVELDEDIWSLSVGDRVTDGEEDSQLKMTW